MFFRIWFLYLSKLAGVGFLLCFAAILTSTTEWEAARWLKIAGLAILLPLGLAGAVICVVLLIRNRIGCPLCGSAGEFVLYGRSPGVECPHCGIVHCKSPMLSFRLSVVPDDSEGDVESE